MQIDQNKRLEDFLTREEIFELVKRERFARDQRHFDIMRACFHDNAYVRTTWYDGYGGEAYVEATRQRMTGVRGGKHWVFPAFARIAGNRATVESPAKIFGPATVNGVEVTFHAYCRFFSRVVRENGVWKLLTFQVLFEHDEMRTVDPAAPLPVDWSVFANLRPSYRFLALVQMAKGAVVSPDLLGDDRPEQLREFHRGEDAWLAGTGE